MCVNSVHVQALDPSFINFGVAEMSMLRRRVVVTGLGLVTPLGVGVSRVWKKLLDGESGIGKLESTDELDYSGLPCQVKCQCLHL